MLGHLQTRRMMQLPPRLGTVESDLERQFQQAASNSSAEGDPFFPNVKMRFANPASGAAEQDQDQVPNIPAWHCFACIHLF